MALNGSFLVPELIVQTDNGPQKDKDNNIATPHYFCGPIETWSETPVVIQNPLEM